MNSSLALSQGDKLNGTVKFNVTYKKGAAYSTFAILTTSDIPNETNLEKLEVTHGSSAEVEPISCATVGEMKAHSGDLLVVKTRYRGGYYGESELNGQTFYISNKNDYSLKEYAWYNMTVWFNGDQWGSPKVKILKLEPVIESLEAPTITGETSFEESTTVTIKSDVSVADIYYTTNGDEPTTSSTLYTDPFTLTETTTVKAIAAYKTVVSPVATCVFEKIDANVTKTIAELAATQNDYPMVKVSFTNAQVVYAEGKNFILSRGWQGA